MSSLTGFAFRNFSFTSPGTATTEDIEFINQHAFDVCAFRLSIASGTATATFFESIDGINTYPVRVYHIEANNFVNSVTAITSGNFLATMGGVRFLRVRKLTAGNTAFTITGRGTYGAGPLSSFLGPAGPDDKDYLDYLTGNDDDTTTVLVHLVNIGTTDPFSGNFLSLTDTVNNGDAIVRNDGSFSAMDFQFRDPRDASLTFAQHKYYPPDSRPVLQATVQGAAANTTVEYGFRVDLSGTDFADVIGFGFSVFAVSNYDYQANAGLLNPDTANRNYCRTGASIRDSTGALLWQANKLDIPWNGGEPGDLNEFIMETDTAAADTQTAGTAAALHIKNRYVPGAAIYTWTTAGDRLGKRHHYGDITKYRDDQTGWIHLEFSLERDRVTDTMDGFYQSPTGYDVHGVPWVLDGLPSGLPVWDFSDADTLDIYCQLVITASAGNFISKDMADPSGLSNDGGEGFPNPPGTTEDPEIQTLYWKDVFVRRRPFSYPMSENFTASTI